MATTNVPIEIVLQDPNNPIVPIPDNPSDNPGENTNISVPNTALGIGGQTTQDGSSNNASNIFTGSNATASIVSIVVLVLALATIATLLVRRYQKHKKSAKSKAEDTEECIRANKKTASRKEKLATATTATLAVLAATVLVGNICMTATNAATDNTNNGTTLTTPDKIQIIANKYEDVTIVASTKAISYATTDTTFGYKIFMSMAGEDANLYLDGDNASEYYFTPTENAGLDDNSWGYSLDGKANYTAMPLLGNALMAQQNTSAVSDEEFTVYYTMNADKDMPFGVYSGEITYDIEGYNGFPDTLTTMQGMTSEICENTYTPNAFKADGVTIEDNVPTATLTDVRDNKTYTIAKLADGKCWMTQSLDLQKEDLLAGVTLDSTNTDHPANGFELPDSQTSGDYSWGSYNDETTINTAHVYDLANDGHEYHNCLDYFSGTCREYDEELIPSSDLGNLYNWYTATAGTGTFSLAGNEAASGSICPAGWKVPSITEEKDITDFSNLYYTYGISEAPTSSYISGDDNLKIFDVPVSIIRSGKYYGYGGSGTGSVLVGIDGIIASNVSASNNNNHSFNIGPDTSNLWGGAYKFDGTSVRCVAR